jgi:hypothetical protein
MARRAVRSAVGVSDHAATCAGAVVAALASTVPAIGAAIGPPWQKDHRLAMAAAIAAARPRT